MSSKLEKGDYVALAEMRRRIRKFLRFAEEGAREEGITPQQHQVLLSIMGQQGRDWASISEIADFLQLKHHTVVGLVDRCSAADLVKRKASTEDRRRVEVVLTDRGEAILSRLAQRNMKELYSLAEVLKYKKP
jgi:DNA-binding MarR family transcriptional regulator